jgi:hypothetical protein
MVSFTDLVPFVSVIAGIAAAFALVYTALTFKRVGKTEQIKRGESTYKDLKELEKDYSALPRDVTTGGKDSAAERHWNSRLFNTLEWYSFLVNQQQIKDKSILMYFKDIIIDYYEDNFLNEATPQQVDDPEEYPEFKGLYKKLTRETQK